MICENVYIDGSFQHSYSLLQQGDFMHETCDSQPYCMPQPLSTEDVLCTCIYMYNTGFNMHVRAVGINVGGFVQIYI